MFYPIIRTSAPVTPAPVTPAPVTPAPVTPAPVTPAPVTPAPVTPGETLLLKGRSKTSCWKCVPYGTIACRCHMLEWSSRGAPFVRSLPRLRARAKTEFQSGASQAVGNNWLLCPFDTMKWCLRCFGYPGCRTCDESHRRCLCGLSAQSRTSQVDKCITPSPGDLTVISRCLLTWCGTRTTQFN